MRNVIPTAGAMAEHVETSLAGLTVKLLRRATSLAKIYFASWITWPWRRRWIMVDLLLGYQGIGRDRLSLEANSGGILICAKFLNLSTFSCA